MEPTGAYQLTAERCSTSRNNHNRIIGDYSDIWPIIDSWEWDAWLQWAHDCRITESVKICDIVPLELFDFILGTLSRRCSEWKQNESEMMAPEMKKANRTSAHRPNSTVVKT